jgi:hypothetical protein
MSMTVSMSSRRSKNASRSPGESASSATATDARRRASSLLSRATSISPSAKASMILGSPVAATIAPDRRHLVRAPTSVRSSPAA